MNDRTDAMTVARGTAEGQQSVAVTTASAQTTNPINAPECLVYANVECFVLAGSSPTATVAAGTPIASGQTIRLRGLQPGDRLAFIAASGSGTAYVRPGA